MKTNPIFLMILFNLLVFCGFTQEVRLVLPVGHSGSVNNIVLSPDSTKLLTTSIDNTAILWDIKRGKPIHHFSLHSDRVTFACFSNNGQYIITCSDDNTAILWDAISGRPVQSIKSDVSPYVDAEFSPDNLSFILIDNNVNLELWQYKKSSFVKEYHRSFYPDATGAFKTHKRCKAFYIYSGKLIVVADESGMIRIINLADYLEYEGRLFNGDIENIVYDMHNKQLIYSGGKYQTGYTMQGNEYFREYQSICFLNVLTGSYNFITKKYGFGGELVLDTIDMYLTDSIMFQLDEKLEYSEFQDLVLVEDRFFADGRVYSYDQTEPVYIVYDIGSEIDAYDFIKASKVFLVNKHSISIDNNKSDTAVIYTLSGDSVAVIKNRNLYKDNIVKPIENSPYLFINGLLEENIYNNIIIDSRNGKVVTTLKSAEISNYYTRIEPHKHFLFYMNYAAAVLKLDLSTARVSIIDSGMTDNQRLRAMHDIVLAMDTVNDVLYFVKDAIDIIGVNLRTEERRKYSTSHRYRINDLAFYSKDYLLTSSADSSSYLIDINSGEAIREFKHPGPVYNVEGWPQRNQLFTANLFINQWNINGDLVKKWNYYATFKGEELFYNARRVIKTDTNNRFYTGGIGADLEIYSDNLSFEHDNNIYGKSDRVRYYSEYCSDYCFDLHPNGRNYAAILYGRAFLFDHEKPKFKKELLGHNEEVSSIRYINNGRELITTGFDNTVRIWDAEKRKQVLVLQGHTSQINEVDIADSLIFTISADNSIKIWKYPEGDLVASFYTFLDDRYIIVTPDDYYSGTKSVIGTLSYKIGDILYPFEQFDLKYNRPDIVLERLGHASPQLIDAYHKAYLKRLKKMGFKEEDLSGEFHIPQSAFENFEYMPVIEESEIEIDLNFEDSKYNLDRYNIWINDVPVYGMKGKSLRDFKSSTFSIKEKLVLSEGRNKIQVSCLNEKGAESYKETVEVTYESKKSETPAFYFIGIGVDKYVEAGHNLNYSVKDIRDLVAGLKEKYGKDLMVDTLFDDNVSQEKVKAIKEKLLQSNINDKVIIAFSGHGLLSADYDYYLAMHNTNFSQPEIGGLPYEDLEWLLDSIPARTKLLLIDACHSGEVDKEELLAINNNTQENVKGAQVSYTYNPTLGMKNSFELMQELFSNLNKGTGATVISAAAGTQFAYEKEELSNGVFTFSILELMKTTPEMTVNQLKAAVGMRVEELTNGMQKPTSRVENVEFDFRVW